MKKSWPIAVLALSVLLVIGLSCYLNPGTIAASAGTLPAVRAQVSVWRRIFQWPEGDTAIAMFLTLIFIAWQALLTRQAIASTEASSQVELRAYVVVKIGAGAYQERERGIRFDGSPELINTGKTPAHRVRYWTNTAILTDAAATAYPFPAGPEAVGEYVTGVGQSYKITALHADYIDAQDVLDVMNAEGRAFYYWGRVTYDDAFGREHTTDFCHKLWFVEADGVWKVHGIYIPGRNHAT